MSNEKTKRDSGKYEEKRELKISFAWSWTLSNFKCNNITIRTIRCVNSFAKCTE